MPVPRHSAWCVRWRLALAQCYTTLGFCCENASAKGPVNSRQRTHRIHRYSDLLLECLAREMAGNKAEQHNYLMSKLVTLLHTRHDAIVQVKVAATDGGRCHLDDHVMLQP